MSKISTARLKRQPRRIIDHHGSGLVHMPLKGGAIAALDAVDFDRMMARRITTQWCLAGDGKGNAYVSVWLPAARTMGMVARLVLDVPRGKVIRYADRNPLNLRRYNLVLDDGFSRQREKDATVNASTIGPGGANERRTAF